MVHFKVLQRSLNTFDEFLKQNMIKIYLANFFNNKKSLLKTFPQPISSTMCTSLQNPVFDCFALNSLIQNFYHFKIRKTLLT